MYRGKGVVGSSLVGTLPSPITMSDGALTRLICKNSIPSIPFPLPRSNPEDSLLSVSTLPYDLPSFFTTPSIFRLVASILLR